MPAGVEARRTGPSQVPCRLRTQQLAGDMHFFLTPWIFSCDFMMVLVVLLPGWEETRGLRCMDLRRLNRPIRQGTIPRDGEMEEVPKGMREKTLVLPGELDSLRAVEEFVLKEVQDPALPADMVNDIRLVVEEIFINIVSYAYPGTKGVVQVKCYFTSGGIYCIQFRDWGVPFDPLKHPDPNLDSDLSHREVGGLGIYLVRQLVQSVRYAREEDSNVLTVCFQV